MGNRGAASAVYLLAMVLGACGVDRRTAPPAETDATPQSTSQAPAPNAMIKDVTPPPGKTMGLDAIVNIDYTNLCQATANGFRYSLSNLQASTEISEEYATDLDYLNADPSTSYFASTPPVTVMGQNGDATITWTSAGTVGNGGRAHFGYSAHYPGGSGLLKELSHTIQADWLFDRPPSEQCNNIAIASEWAGDDVATAVTATLQNLMRQTVTVSTYAYESERALEVADLVRTSPGYAIKSPISGPDEVAAGERLAVAVPFSADSRATVLVSEWTMRESREPFMVAFHGVRRMASTQPNPTTIGPPVKSDR